MPMDENGIGTDPIVIVGMALEAPGGIDTAEEFWELLSHGREALSPFPVDRGWAVRELFAGSRRNGFKEIHDRGGFLTGATTFDPEFFGISPREAIAMDPQQRVALRVCWRALENSGINPDDMAGHDMGCYLGASATGYGPQMAEFSEYSGHLLAGTALSVISGRIAYTLGSMGPAVTIDSSCASALVAFHAAVRAVQDGDCDVALAGGVNVLGSPGFFVEFSKQHALADDGHCRAYSAQASGTVWRRILAEVLGSAVNHDGRSAGLSAPNGAAQVNLFRRAMSQAGIRAKDVGMIEGHGTGTRLGDRTELQSLAQTYGETEPGGGALLGSVKSNLGHALAASGALGLAKVLIAAEHGAIPATLHATDPSPEIDWDKQGLRLAATLTPWPAIEGHRVAATSAFGIAGTNAHVIISLPEVA
jgi:mycobactin polyketide synthetase MbtC